MVTLGELLSTYGGSAVEDAMKGMPTSVLDLPIVVVDPQDEDRAFELSTTYDLTVTLDRLDNMAILLEVSEDCDHTIVHD